jgi:hypothetical protein
MVQLHEQGDLVVGQAGQEPHPPQGPGRVQPPGSQLLGRTQEVRFAAAGGKGKDPDVLAEIKGRGIHPQRPTQPSPRHVNDLPEPRDQMQPGGDRPAHGLDPEAAAGVEQVGAI